MKKFLNILLAFVVLMFCTSATLKKDKRERKVKTPKAERIIDDVDVYGFGFAASFIDTVAYYTDIQLLDSAKLSNKVYLEERYQYSYQLKDYLEETLRKNNYVCMTFYSPDMKKLQKDFDKLIAKYRKAGVGLRQISVAEFKYKKVEY